MTEKLPQFKRPEPKIVGSASLEKKEEHKKMIMDNFGEEHYKQFSEAQRMVLESVNRKKEPYEKLAIKQANDVTNNILSEFNLTPFDIPEQNIYILPGDLYIKMDRDRSHVAATDQESQLIALNTDKLAHPVDRVAAILHEIIHLKGFLELEVTEVTKDNSRPYRSGLRINSAQRKGERTGFFTAFEGLDEAVVSEIERIGLEKIIAENPYLKKDYYWGGSEETRQLYEECKERIAKAKSKRPKDVSWVKKGGKSFGILPRCEGNRVLDYIVDHLYDDNKDRYDTRGDIMKLFFKAHFSGRLLEIARLTEKSFGKGSFRMIGMMKDTNSIHLVMDYLTKQSKRVEG